MPPTSTFPDVDPPLTLPSLPCALEPIDATCIVIGAIIGVGIFFTPSKVALLTGSAFLSLDRILTGAVFIDGIFFVLTGLAVFTLSRRGKNPSGLAYPIAPIIFVLGEIGVVIGSYLNADARIAA